VSLLRLRVEVEYTDWARRLVYRGRPFWVSRDGLTALSIPHAVRSRESRRVWHPFDHDSRSQRCGLFNFWPVSDAALNAFILPDAPPFFFHRIYASGTRVKFGDSNGHGYGQSGSYLYYREQRLEMLAPSYVEKLPEPWLSRWTAAHARISLPHSYPKID
jgi:hypothetical protein